MFTTKTLNTKDGKTGSASADTCVAVNLKYAHKYGPVWPINEPHGYAKCAKANK